MAIGQDTLGSGGLVAYRADMTLDELPVSDEEKEILEKRFEEHIESPDDALTLEEFKKRLAERL